MAGDLSDPNHDLNGFVFQSTQMTVKLLHDVVLQTGLCICGRPKWAMVLLWQ